MQYGSDCGRRASLRHPNWDSLTKDQKMAVARGTMVDLGCALGQTQAATARDAGGVEAGPPLGPAFGDG